MHAQKVTKGHGPGARVAVMADRHLEEERLLQLWAAADSERSIDDFDSEDSSDRQFDMDSAGVHGERGRFDA